MYKKSEIKALAEKVNDYWIGQNPDVGDCAWERATYFLGNVAAYEILGKKEYLDYALKWAEKNNWEFYKDVTEKRKYTTSADSQLCGETYLKLMDSVPGCGTDENIKRSIEYTLCDNIDDYWWWIDTIHMALPLYNMLGVRYNDERCFDKVNKLFNNTRKDRECYDEEEHLWFRDEKQLFSKKKTINGKKVFWSRGNGWVFAGLGRTFKYLPKDNKYYNEYLEIYKEMAESIAKCIQPDGFFRTSLIEPTEFESPETSGTALFALGYLFGINLGLLDKKYLDLVCKSFAAINTVALEPSGRLGWVQTIADCPEVPVKKESTNDYAYGTYLQICKEILPHCE